VKHAVVEVIKQRYSCRTYEERPLEKSDREALNDALASLGDAPFANRVRFSLVAAIEGDSKSLKGLGTYGLIRGAAGFIVGAAEPGPQHLEDYGYLLERAVLEATDLGLGTCWLGGSFTKSSFARKIDAKPDEIVAAVVSVGYPAERSRSDWVRRHAGSDRRLPSASLFFDGTSGEPLDLSRAGGYADALEALRWAPSASNKQPWRVMETEGVWRFYLQRTKGYRRKGPVSLLLKIADLQRVDMGIAMCHFELVAQERGLAGRWVLEEPAPGVGDRLPGSMGDMEDRDPLEYTATWVPAAG
jgi:nitroreductase